MLFYHNLTEVGELALGYAARNVASPFLPTPCSLRDAQRLDVVGHCVADPPTCGVVDLGHIQFCSSTITFPTCCGLSLKETEQATDDS